MDNNKLKLEYLDIESINPNPKNAKIHGKEQINEIANSLSKNGFNAPIGVRNGVVIVGNGRYLAAKKLGLKRVPTVNLDHLTDKQTRLYILADNKLAEKSEWDLDILIPELEDIVYSSDFDWNDTGFDSVEIDNLLYKPLIQEEKTEKEEKFPEIKVEKRVKSGEIWQLGKHKLFCGDALISESYERLLGSKLADIVVTDPPYNVKISGNVTTQKQHKEFAEASGEMTDEEFTSFLKNAFSNLVKFSKDGSIHYHFMDWRHMQEMLDAGEVYTEIKNLCVWAKDTAGMGSLYRSQHELVFVFKNGTAPHTNNVELGKHGRYRTNVWKYKGMHASNKQAKDLGKLHPTVKTTSMLMDILLDCSNPQDTVLDCFGGSGSTLIAAERTGRTAALIEISPEYCDVIIARWENETGKKAELQQKGENNNVK
jgi:DNA modification methylase